METSTKIGIGVGVGLLLLGGGGYLIYKKKKGDGASLASSTTPQRTDTAPPGGGHGVAPGLDRPQIKPSMPTWESPPLAPPPTLAPPINPWGNFSQTQPGGGGAAVTPMTCEQAIAVLSKMSPESQAFGNVISQTLALGTDPGALERIALMVTQGLGTPGLTPEQIAAANKVIECCRDRAAMLKTLQAQAANLNAQTQAANAANQAANQAATMAPPITLYSAQPNQTMDFQAQPQPQQAPTFQPSSFNPGIHGIGFDIGAITRRSRGSITMEARDAAVARQFRRPGMTRR
jgi:LPXTG-motif cell wall-anchored protein